MNRKELFNQKLLVEGKDDQHVIWSLCNKFKIKESFDIIDCDGVDNLKEQLPVRFKQSDVKTIGVIFDADSDLISRWVSFKSIINSIGFRAPDEFPSDGLIITNDNGYKLGVWIMPNNNTNGMLEDFITFLVPKKDKLLPIVDSTLSYLEENSINNYSLSHKSKAKIHTWLSWQEEPGTPLGLSITKRYLTTDDSICMMFVSWLDKLFN